MRKIFQLFIGILFSSAAMGQQTKTLPPAEFEKEIKTGKGQILDVRRPDEFSAGHIKGAVNINWQDLEHFRANAVNLDKNKPVYVYCKGGVRSAKATEWLEKNGFKKVIGLEGGFDDWQKAGKPVQK